MDSVIAGQGLSGWRQLGNFVRHFIEMCIPMCVGVGLANLLLGMARTSGLPDPREESPALALVALAVFITLPMAGWMRFRGMPWRPIVEMTASGIVVVLVATMLGVISADRVAVGTLCGLECVGMVAAMLARLDLYTGRTGHHVAHGAGTV